ncbi:MAG: site-specific integrase [Saprospiraceae bacterium]|nr:site-specific integrase [Saprospiraceae bacterium]
MARPVKIPTPRFNLRNHDPIKDKDQPTLIVLVLRYAGKKLVWSTQEKVKPRFWNQKKGRVNITVNNHQDADINTSLNHISNLSIEVFKELGSDLSITDFKKELNYRTGREIRPEEGKLNVPLMKFIPVFIDQKVNATNAKPDSWKVFKACFQHLVNFANEHYNGKLNYEDIDWNFRAEFEDWLYKAPRSLSKNYAGKLMTTLKRLLNEAMERDYHNNNIHKKRGWNIKKEHLSKVVLSFEELEEIFKLDLSNNKRLEPIKDAFLIGAYSGLRFSDFTRLKPEHIIKDQGAEMIELYTQKTGTLVVIPLSPILKQLLEKYNFQAPTTISNQKFNQYIKEVCELAGITNKVRQKKNVAGKRVDQEIEKFKLISAHSARRSFATNFYQLGFPAVELMQITGHATEKQFMEYINIDKRRNAKSMAARIAQAMGGNHLRIAK